MKPGDLVLCHSAGVIGKSIRWAQRNLEGNRFSEWNHVAVLDRFEDGEWYIIQAEAKGVTNDKTLNSVAPGGRYEIVPLPVNAEPFLAFCRSQVGKAYGYLTILSCAVDMWLPNAICLRQANTWICSGLVAAALWFSGFDMAKKWTDLYTVTPAEIAQACSSTS